MVSGQPLVIFCLPHPYNVHPAHKPAACPRSSVEEHAVSREAGIDECGEFHGKGGTHGWAYGLFCFCAKQHVIESPEEILASRVRWLEAALELKGEKAAMILEVWIRSYDIWVVFALVILQANRYVAGEISGIDEKRHLVVVNIVLLETGTGRTYPNHRHCSWFYF